MLSPNHGTPLDNKLLSSLPRGQIDLLTPHLTTEQLPQGEVLLQAGEEFDHVYFPHNGMLSLLVVLRDGKAIEVAQPRYDLARPDVYRLERVARRATVGRTEADN